MARYVVTENIHFIGGKLRYPGDEVDIDDGEEVCAHLVKVDPEPVAQAEQEPRRRGRPRASTE